MSSGDGADSRSLIPASARNLARTSTSRMVLYRSPLPSGATRSSRLGRPRPADETRMRRIPRMTCGSPWSAVKPRPTDAAGSSRAAFRIVSAGTSRRASITFRPTSTRTPSCPAITGAIRAARRVRSCGITLRVDAGPNASVLQQSQTAVALRTRCENRCRDSPVFGNWDSQSTERTL